MDFFQRSLPSPPQGKYFSMSPAPQMQAHKVSSTIVYHNETI